MALVGQIVTVSDVLMDGTVNNYIMGADANVFQTNYNSSGVMTNWSIGNDNNYLKYFENQYHIHQLQGKVGPNSVKYSSLQLDQYKFKLITNVGGTPNDHPCYFIAGNTGFNNEVVLGFWDGEGDPDESNGALYINLGNSVLMGQSVYCTASNYCFVGTTCGSQQIQWSNAGRPYFGYNETNYVVSKTDLDSAISTGTSGMATQAWVSQNYQIKGNYQPAGSYALSSHEHSYLGQAGYYYLSYDGTKWTSNIPISCTGLQVDNVAINQNLSVTGQITASGAGFFNGGTWAVASINSLNGISACSGALWLGKISAGSDAWIVTPKLQITNPANSTGAHTVTASGSGGNRPGELMWSTGSSKRWKHDIKNVEDNKLNPNLLYNIPVRQFKFNNDYIPSTDQRYNIDVIGFIAEEVYKEYPIAADYYKDSEGNVVCENWNERFIIPPMLKLIQDQHQEIETLKAEIAEIKELLKNK